VEISWEDLLRRRTVHSPLRYPGGKRRLVPYVAAALKANGLEPDLLVEPFAGGASVALELVADGFVKQIAIADRDPYIAAFWETAFFDCDWLCRQVEQADVSLREWERIKTTRFRARRAMAFACLFLNRTSFNGALHRRAGPIGGKGGASEYELDCRFPRKRLIARLRAAEALADAGKVKCVAESNALDFVARIRTEASDENQSLFFYFDPPFWAKSQTLYRHSFAADDHQAFASALRYVKEPYLLSYDPAPEIAALYGYARQRTVELLYTATQRSAGAELVITNLAALPADTRLWRTNGEWRALRRASVVG
jgi:DNA adenine methylase